MEADDLEAMRNDGLDHRITVCEPSAQLPSAQTCFNKMKIPTYPSMGVLRAKLLLAIQNCVSYQNA